MLGNDADALDATQDALLAAIRGLSRFDGRSSFATWLYRVATNTCIDELRRRRRRPVTGIAFDVAEVVDAMSSEVPGLFAVGGGAGGPDSGSSPDQEAGRPDRSRPGGPSRAGPTGAARQGRDPADVVAARMDVDAALALLPVEFRTAVVLRDVCDLPYDEIARILDVPVGTVRSRIARARTALAATWQPGAGPADRLARDAAGNRTASPHVRTSGSDRPGPITPQPQQEERTQ